jgi:hypothetical protein
MTHTIAVTYAASEEAVQTVLKAPVQDDGRSEWRWIRFANGDLVLAVYPLGNTYEALEKPSQEDYQRAEANNDTNWVLDWDDRGRSRRRFRKRSQKH